MWRGVVKYTNLSSAPEICLNESANMKKSPVSYFKFHKFFLTCLSIPTEIYIVFDESDWQRIATHSFWTNDNKPLLRIADRNNGC
jgi:hypothetical protein